MRKVKFGGRHMIELISKGDPKVDVVLEWAVVLACQS